MSTSTPGVQLNPACPECGCKNTAKKGKRRNRLQTLQIYRCTECLHRFTGTPGKNKTYPFKLVLETISTFNLGHSLTETQNILRRRFHRDIPERTISSWLTEYRPLTTYARLRPQARKLYPADSVIRSHTFHHCQVYRFQVHQAKLDLLTQPVHTTAPADFDASVLKEYLVSIENHFPHHFFQEAEHRSSKFPADLRPPIERKENFATRLAALALPTAPNNKKRHETLQRFMLVNDSVTVAVEIPVFLTKEDIECYRQRGFHLDFESHIITGHIDFLQIRNGHIHILDYKPEARKETHAHVQLTIYALALARRTGLPLKLFITMRFSSPKRILAVDPGMQYLGIAVLEGEDIIWYSVRTFPGRNTVPDIRPQVQQYLTGILQKYRPTVLAVEEPFYAQSILSDNLKKLTNSIKTWGKWKGLTVRSYTPPTVKAFFCRDQKTNEANQIRVPRGTWHW